MNLRLIGNLQSPWLPGAMEAMSKAGLRLDAILYDPADAVGYTDAARTGIMGRYELLAAQGHQIAYHASHGKSAFHYWRFGRFLRRRWPNDGIPLITLYGGGLAIAAAASRIRPRVHYLMGSDVLRLGRRAKPLIARLYGSADLILANGEVLASEAGAMCGKEVESLLLGVDLSRFTPGNPADHPVRFVCPRGMLAVYNNETICLALQKLVSQEAAASQAAPEDAGTPLWEARFLAGGPLLEPMKNSFAGPRIVFEGGLASDQMVNAYQNGHAVVSMSLSDGSSTAVWEALACGLVPLLSDIPANRVFAPVASFHPTDDPHGLAAAMLLLAIAPPDWSEARSKMRRFAETHADADANMAQLKAMLAKL